MSSWWRKIAEQRIADGAVLSPSVRGSWPRIVASLDGISGSDLESWERKLALDAGAGSAGSGSWPRRQATALDIVANGSSWPRILAQEAPFSILGLGPEAWWKFDDGSGTTPQDSSGNGHHGEFVSAGDGPAWIAGPPPSLDFHGADLDGVVITGDLLGEPAAITICGWCNLDGASGDLVNINDKVIFRFQNNLSIIVNEGGVIVGTGATGPTGLHHFAAVYDPGNTRQDVYVDGVSVASGSNGTAIAYGVGGNTYIARNPSGSASMDGRIWNVVVFPFGLSTEQVVQVMEATA